MFSFAVAFIFSFFCGVIIYDTTHVHSTTYKIKKLKKYGLKKNIKICLLSDLHGVNFTSGKYSNDVVVEKIEKANPDIIIMAGDIANAKFQFSDSNALDLVRRLSRKYPVYYGIGNHEARLMWSPERFNVPYSRLISSLKKNGAKVLDNASCYLEEYGIKITGLTLSEEYYKKITKKKTDDSSLLEFIPANNINDGYEVLIAHNPEYFKDYVKRGSNLILSGHLHGGIMRLPLKFGAISPRFALFPRYAGGLYKAGKTRMIVSRGLGQHTIPVRVFNTAELVFIELNK